MSLSVTVASVRGVTMLWTKKICSILAEYLGEDYVDPTLIGHSLLGEEDDTTGHDMAGENDGTAIYLYVDAVLDRHEQTIGRVAPNDEPVFIGGNSERPGREWNGRIDDVRLYSYALCVEDVRTLCEGRGSRIDKP